MQDGWRRGRRSGSTASAVELHPVAGVRVFGGCLGGVWADTNDLGVELGQTGLAVVVEDQHGVYHGGQASGSWCLRSEGLI